METILPLREKRESAERKSMHRRLPRHSRLVPGIQASRHLLLRLLLRLLRPVPRPVLLLTLLLLPVEQLALLR